MSKLVRIDANLNKIENPHGVDISVFANDGVEVENSAVDEAAALAEISLSCERLSEHDFFGDIKGSLEKIAISPDFHKGAGIPVGTTIKTNGFVMPRAVGGDICCGMRFTMTDVSIKEFNSIGKKLDQELRRVFFEGGRNIALDEIQRSALLREGLVGLVAERKRHDVGVLSQIDEAYLQENLLRSHYSSFKTADHFSFSDYICAGGGVSYDSQIGSIGGGNHFVELQEIEKTFDQKSSKDWGLNPGMVSIMAHSGSIGLGSIVGAYFEEQAKKIWPKNVKAPLNDFFLLPTTGKHKSLAESYFSAMGNAANFAIANRLFLTVMVKNAMETVLKRKVRLHHVYDAPHNLVTECGEHAFLHRKGTMPAEITKEFPDGHPVIVPGSMGDLSWILKGLGNTASLCSSAHGAGRIRSRGVSRHINLEEIERIRIVSKIDPDDHRHKSRPDILEKYWKALAEEAPSSYKSSTPVVATLVDAGTTSRVCSLRPLLTIKG